MPGQGEDVWSEESGPRGHAPRLASRMFAAISASVTAESDRWPLWVPVLFAAGILIYFALPLEPRWESAAAFLLASLGLFVAMRDRTPVLILGGALLLIAFGFAAAKIRTESVRAPVLAEELRGVTVEGWVERYELRDEARARATLRVTELDALPPLERPFRVRISMHAASGRLETGDRVSVRAALRPLPEPVQPRGFDFARTAWFDQIGAVGYALGRPVVLADGEDPPWDLAAWAPVDRLRGAINARIRAALPGKRGEVAAALITGERAGIPENDNRAMRDSGLFHILSISGLHMVIMAGTLFWAVRAGLALIPSLALRFPIRKWAAVAALVTAFVYLLLSGAAVPTVRAWIMMSVVLIAVLLDRPALTMRNVALAALIILILSPESLFDASFQMSFAAVIGLIALVEAHGRQESESAEDVSAFWRLLRRIRIFIVGDVVTTLVATAAVAPFAIYHFHRMSHYGVFANLLALPLVTFLIMPFALLALIAMPFGLEAWPLQIMGTGIALLLDIGTWIASWPGAVSVVPAMPPLSLLLMAFGGLWFCLWQTRWRALGLVFLAAGLLGSGENRKPDLLVERDGRSVALRSAEGSLAFPPATEASYSIEKWLLADGDKRDAKAASASGTFRCDHLGCIGTLRGKTVAIVRHVAALEEDCRVAEIVVAPFTVGKACKGPRVVIDRRALKEGGAHALYLDGLSIRSESVAEARGQRPWVPQREIAAKAAAPAGRAHAYGFDADNAESGPRSDPEE